MARDKILVWNFEDGFTGWLIKRENSFSGKGVDLICRPLGLNPTAQIRIRSVDMESTKQIDKVKIFDGAYTLILIVPKHGGVILDTIIDMNTELQNQLSDTKERLIITDQISKTKQSDFRMDMESELKKIGELAKALSSGKSKSSRGSPFGKGGEGDLDE